jgi:membrane-associated phospholipid phosphatase
MDPRAGERERLARGTSSGMLPGMSSSTSRSFASFSREPFASPPIAAVWSLVRRALRPEDAYHLGFGALATAIVVATGAPGGPALVWMHAGVAAAILSFAPAARRWPVLPLRFVRDLYHLPLAVVYYRETAALHEAVWGGLNFDDVVAGLDDLLFGGQPSLLFARTLPNQVVCELMHLTYLSYYALTLIGGLALWTRRDDGEVFPRALHAIVFTMMVCYTTYVVFPVVGPPFHWPGLHHAGLDGFFRRALDGLLVLDRPTGAFPSSHVAVTVAFLSAFWRYLRPMFWLTIVPASLLIVSTVYVRAHYAADAIAGLVVGLVAFRVGERVREPVLAWLLGRR